MGLPPKHLITRRLINKFFKNRPITKQGNQTTESMNELLNCWKKYGIDAEECLGVLNNFHVLAKNDREFRKFGKELAIKENVMAQLNKPAYKHGWKGKHKDYFSNRKKTHDSFLDGVL